MAVDALSDGVFLLSIQVAIASNSKLDCASVDKSCAAQGKHISNNSDDDDDDEVMKHDSLLFH